MDPAATLRRIQQALEDEDDDLAEEAIEDLRAWIANGGHAPPVTVEFLEALAELLETL